MVVALALALVVVGTALAVGGLVRMDRLNQVVASFRSRRHDARSRMDLVDAIASWTENLRDLLASSSGLEQAIISSHEHAPRRIAVHVRQLAADLRYRSMEESLRDFAERVDHPTCDFVVLALLSTVRNPTRELAPLLGQLAECARNECDVYLRVWVSRARSRTAVRIIFVSMGVFAGGLLVFNPAYVGPFFTKEGSLVLAGMSAIFGTALVWILRISRVPERGRLLRGAVGS